jgi:hypothetical protein
MLLAEFFVSLFQLATYLLVLVFLVGVVPYAVILIQEELGIKQKPRKPEQSGHHRWGKEDANNLAQVLLMERRHRETAHYKVTHHAIAGKRA